MPLESVSAHIINTDSPNLVSRDSSISKLRKCNSDATCSRGTRFQRQPGDIQHTVEFVLKRAIRELSKSSSKNSINSAETAPEYRSNLPLEKYMVDEVSRINIISETEESASQCKYDPGATHSATKSGLDQLMLPQRTFRVSNTEATRTAHRQPISRSVSDWSQQSHLEERSQCGSSRSEGSKTDEVEVFRPLDHPRTRSDPTVHSSDRLRVRFKDYPSDEDRRM